ncbi:hypothetical protein ACWDF1_03930 [Streptomyces coelicoflavus]|uniref:Cell envelope biogenesis protein OmpA n=1 Tax=Streptomyces coelicoflavus TaxID=285562 RepID=A0A6N9UHA9_9ACTN|nr:MULTISPECIES: hypothetical protein [Streptomyces]NEB17077.1 hypothetical protein [Streptomyces coelicoflavus]OWA22695.1 hypothetical protein B9W64_00945 [Streptomyces sp. CS159]
MPLTAAARPQTADLRGARRPDRLGAAEAEILRIVTDARTPVFVTVRPDGRRRYSYWRPLDSATGRGGCYVALPTAACDALHAAGRTALGEPLADPNRIIHRVSATRTPAAPLRALPERARAA